MTFADRNIIDIYTNMLEGLSPVSKLELIENLSKSIRKEKTSKEAAFYKSFGGFISEKSAEETIKEIKSSRKFRKREIKL